VNGVGFTAGSVVSFDGLAVPTTLISASQLQAARPHHDVAAGGHCPHVAHQAVRATVQNSSNQSAIWKVTGITGGNSVVGTITASGAYGAPGGVPKPAVVTVSATAVADPTQTTTASVTIVRK